MYKAVTCLYTKMKEEYKMKKILSITLVTILVFSALVLTACGGSSSGSEDLSNSKYVGTWKNTGISMGTESGKLDVEFTLVIKGDGTGELVSEGETSSFTWKPVDKGFKTAGDMKLTFTDDGDNIKATIIGADLTFEKQK